MPVSLLGDMTWDEVQALDGANTVAVLPTGAVEAHGPHLPLNTDVVIAEAMARAGAEKLAAHGLDVLILPPLSYTCANFAAGFPGTLSVTAARVTGELVDIVQSLSRHGISMIVVANAHLDPAHLSSIHAAVEQCTTGGIGHVVFPDITRKPWASRLTDEFKSGACHAGQFESSIVMAARPDLVRDAVRRKLEANPVSLSTAIRNGLLTFEEAGGPQAYFGYPADASSDEGTRTIELLGSIVADAVVAERRTGSARQRGPSQT